MTSSRAGREHLIASQAYFVTSSRRIPSTQAKLLGPIYNQKSSTLLSRTSVSTSSIALSLFKAALSAWIFVFILNSCASSSSSLIRTSSHSRTMAASSLSSTSSFASLSFPSTTSSATSHLIDSRRADAWSAKCFSSSATCLTALWRSFRARMSSASRSSSKLILLSRVGDSSTAKDSGERFYWLC